jgi:Fis family transcriptional regulator
MSSRDAATGVVDGNVACTTDGPARVLLSVAVERALRTYMEDLQGQAPCNLYEQVLAEVEAPLLRVIMHEVDGNQCRASAMLGLSRGTLRKKLKEHGLL